MVPFFRKIKPFIFAIAMVGMMVNIITPAIALAATRSGFDEIAHQTERWMRMRGVYGCIYESGFVANDSGSILDGKLISQGETAVGYLNEDGKVSCNDGAFITNSNNKIGFEGNDYSYCAAQPSSYRLGGPDTEKTSNVEGCVGGSGLFNNTTQDKTIATQWLSGLKKQVSDYKSFMTDSGGQYDESKYYMYYQSLITFCGATQGDKYGGTAREKSIVEGDNKKVVVNLVSGKGDTQAYIYTLDRKQTDIIDDVYQEMNADSKDLTCQYMAERTWDLDTATAKWINSYNKANPDASVDELSVAKNPSSSGNTSCNIDGIGWIVCPVMSFMGTVNNLMYNAISEMLEFDSSKMQDKDLYTAWSVFRNIANVLFVIAFLVIIYSQMTGVGVSNYGIKKLLPKIIVAAVLVNISFWICAIAVDVSNILGSSLKGFFDGFAVSGGDADGGTGIGGVAVGTLVTILLSGGLVAGIAAAALAISVPVLLAVALAIIMIIVILMARQALIILLIVIAPIAFVCQLLPNTEQWFKKWTKLFGTLLMLYPIIAVVFGASAFAARLISNSATGDDMYLMQLTAVGVATLPLFFVPSLLKNSLNATGSLGAKLGGLSGKATSRVGKKAMAESRLGEAKQAFDRRGLEKQVRRRTGGGWVARKTDGKSGILGAMNTVADPTRLDNTKLGAYLGGSMGAAQAKAKLSKLQAENIEIEKGHVKDLDANGLKNILNSSSSTDESKAAALDRLVKISDAGDYVSEINSAISSSSSVVRRATASALENHGPGWIKASDLDNISTGAAAQQGVTLQSIAGNNVAQGVLSEEKMVGETAGDLKFAWTNSQIAGKQKLVDTAHALKNNDQLKGRIKHNAVAIDNLESGISPP